MIIKRPYIKHLVIEIFSIKNVNKVEDVYRKIELFINKCGLNIVKEVNHNFSPKGFTLAFVLSESHIIFHSWPENNYLNIDFMSCTPIIPLENIVKFAKEVFKSNKIKIREIKYGNK